MNGFKTIFPQEISDNLIKRIGTDWMLITSEAGGQVNTMTASWGGSGVLWNQPVAFIFVRPSRYTYELLDQSEHFSLTFFPEGYREKLADCGKYSGRDMDKIAHSGFHLDWDQDVPVIIDGDLSLVCRKMYVQDLTPDGFVSQDKEAILSRFYPDGDFHRMLVGQVVNVLVKE